MHSLDSYGLGTYRTGWALGQLLGLGGNGGYVACGIRDLGIWFAIESKKVTQRNWQSSQLKLRHVMYVTKV